MQHPPLHNYFSQAFPREYSEGLQALADMDLDSSQCQTNALEDQTKAVVADLKVVDEAKEKEGGGGNSRGRGDKEKQETKKRWQVVLNRSISIIGGRGASSQGGHNRNSRGSLEEAQSLLEEAAAMPPFHDVPGDDSAEILRETLGQIVKVKSKFASWNNVFLL